VDKLCSHLLTALTSLKFHIWSVRFVSVSEEGVQSVFDPVVGAFEDQVEFIANNFPDCRSKGILEFLIEGPSIVDGSKVIAYQKTGS